MTDRGAAEAGGDRAGAVQPARSRRGSGSAGRPGGRLAPDAGGSPRAGTPEVVALLERNPFPDAPPRFVRLVRYDYRFTTPEERRRTSAWWVRERLE